MALTRTIIEKIDAHVGNDRTMAKDLKTLLNRCEEGRQTKRTIEDFLKRTKKKNG